MALIIRDISWRIWLAAMLVVIIAAIGAQARGERRASGRPLFFSPIATEPSSLPLCPGMLNGPCTIESSPCSLPSRFEGTTEDCEVVVLEGNYGNETVTLSNVSTLSFKGKVSFLSIDLIGVRKEGYITIGEYMGTHTINPLSIPFSISRSSKAIDYERKSKESIGSTTVVSNSVLSVSVSETEAFEGSAIFLLFQYLSLYDSPILINSFNGINIDLTLQYLDIKSSGTNTSLPGNRTTFDSILSLSHSGRDITSPPSCTIFADYISASSSSSETGNGTMAPRFVTLSSPDLFFSLVSFSNTLLSNFYSIFSSTSSSPELNCDDCSISGFRQWAEVSTKPLDSSLISLSLTRSFISPFVAPLSPLPDLVPFNPSNTGYVAMKCDDSTLTQLSFALSPSPDYSLGSTLSHCVLLDVGISFPPNQDAGESFTLNNTVIALGIRSISSSASLPPHAPFPFYASFYPDSVGYIWNSTIRVESSSGGIYMNATNFQASKNGRVPLKISNNVTGIRYDRLLEETMEEGIFSGFTVSSKSEQKAPLQPLFIEASSHISFSQLTIDVDSIMIMQQSKTSKPMERGQEEGEIDLSSSSHNLPQSSLRVEGGIKITPELGPSAISPTSANEPTAIFFPAPASPTLSQPFIRRSITWTRPNSTIFAVRRGTSETMKLEKLVAWNQLTIHAQRNPINTSVLFDITELTNMTIMASSMKSGLKEDGVTPLVTWEKGYASALIGQSFFAPFFSSSLLPLSRISIHWDTYFTSRSIPRRDTDYVIGNIVLEIEPSVQQSGSPSPAIPTSGSYYIGVCPPSIRRKITESNRPGYVWPEFSMSLVNISEGSIISESSSSSPQSPASPTTMIFATMVARYIAPEGSDQCRGEAPAEGFVCIQGHWVFSGSLSQNSSLVIPPGSIVIYGNFTLNGSLIFQSTTSTIVVKGCVSISDHIVLQIDPNTNPNHKSTILVQDSDCPSPLSKLPIKTVFTKKSCKKTKASVHPSSSKSSLVVLFSTDTSACNTKWVILGAVLGAVVIIAAVLAGVVIYCVKKSSHVRLSQAQVGSPS